MILYIIYKVRILFGTTMWGGGGTKVTMRGSRDTIPDNPNSPVDYSRILFHTDLHRVVSHSKYTKKKKDLLT